MQIWAICQKKTTKWWKKRRQKIRQAWNCTQKVKMQKKKRTSRQIIAHNPYQNTVESAKWNKQTKCITNFAILKRKKTATTQKKKRNTKAIGMQKHFSWQQHVAGVQKCIVCKQAKQTWPKRRWQEFARNQHFLF